MTGPGPGIAPPLDHRAARWDPDGNYLESLVLATVHSWTLSQPKIDAVNLILRHFVAGDVYSAMCELSVSIGVTDKPGTHRNTAERSAGELYAAELFDMITNLSASKTLPKIVVSSLALPMVPVSTLKTSDEVSVSSRLETMETGLKKLTDAVTKATAQSFGGARPRQASPLPAVTITPAFSQQLGVTGQPGQAGPGVVAPGGNQPPQSTTFADVAGAVPRPRLGSQGGQKRAHAATEQPFIPANQGRRRRPVNHGSSQVVISEVGGQAAPVEFYVGNTTPDATESIVAEVLVRCAKGLEPNTEFQVLKVEQLAKHIVDARTKCWKVVVPFKYKELMDKSEMFPPGWCHRKFFAPRKSPNPAKQPRREDSIVQQVIQDQQRAAQEAAATVQGAGAAGAAAATVQGTGAAAAAAAAASAERRLQQCRAEAAAAAAASGAADMDTASGGQAPGRGSPVTA